MAFLTLQLESKLLTPEQLIPEMDHHLVAQLMVFSDEFSKFKVGITVLQ